SGLMMAQYTSAALASENKNLSFPSSVDSIPVSGDQEDHVSMGMNGANNLRKVVDNVRNILAVELIGGCQAQEYKGLDLTPPLEKLYHHVRQEIPPIGDDRELASLIDGASELLSDGELLDEFTREFGIE
ncbi:MAG: aromatic amino acid lyase, partial [Candidatus Bipolaricaulota bacterium]